MTASLPGAAQSSISEPDGESQELAKSKFLVAAGLHVPLGALVAFMLAVVAAVYSLDRVLWIDPLKDEIQHAKQQLGDADVGLQAASKRLRDTDDAYRAAIAERDSPLLISPTNDAEVVASEIPLRWHYGKSNKLQSYVVQIVPADGPESPPIIRQVVRPEEEVYYFPTSLLEGHRRAFWRVVPGSVVDGATLSTGPASAFSYFTWDPSTVARIRRTGRITVGINPQLTGPFERLDSAGKLVGLDIDLINWLAERLGKRIGMDQPIRVEWKALPWGELLPNLVDHDVDLVISSMTRTAERESRFKGVRFTDGYYTTHQLLVSRSVGGIESLKDLNKSHTVGAMADTTNQRAARLLGRRFGFKVSDDFNTFDDLYSALDSHIIDAALVDDVFVSDKLANRRFRKVGRDLDQELASTSFYSEVIGRGSEAYAIAVSDAALVGPAGGTLLDLLNELLRTEECKGYIKSLVTSVEKR